jgi:hypothetical protein
MVLGLALIAPAVGVPEHGVGYASQLMSSTKILLPLRGGSLQQNVIGIGIERLWYVKCVLIPTVGAYRIGKVE